MKRFIQRLIVLGVPGVLVGLHSFAWDAHPFFMRFVLQDLTPAQQNILSRSFKPSTEDESAKFYQALSAELLLNPHVRLAPIQGSTLREIFLSQAVDEPDGGMDNNIEDLRADPKGDRPFMGGRLGPNSRGFRHMFFGGWKRSQPIQTFQIPIRSLGLAPERTQLIAEKARQLIHSENLFWGFRLLAWAMHYLQDLSQPFHAVQIPSLRMPAWGELFSWPPTEIFQKLVSESTRRVSNYHYAYEAYTYDQLSQSGESPLKNCLRDAQSISKLHFDPKRDSPFQLAQAVAQASVEIASEVGQSTVDFFGSELKKSGIDVANKLGGFNVKGLAYLPERVRDRERLEKVTCIALANGVLASQYLLYWAL